MGEVNARARGLLPDKCAPVPDPNVDGWTLYQVPAYVPSFTGLRARDRARGFGATMLLPPLERQRTAYACCCAAVAARAAAAGIVLYLDAEGATPGAQPMAHGVHDAWFHQAVATTPCEALEAAELELDQRGRESLMRALALLDAAQEAFDNAQLECMAVLGQDDPYRDDERDFVMPETVSDSADDRALAQAKVAGDRARELLTERMANAAYHSMDIPALPSDSEEMRRAMWAEMTLDAMTGALMGVIPSSVACAISGAQAGGSDTMGTGPELAMLDLARHDVNAALGFGTGQALPVAAVVPSPERQQLARLRASAGVLELAMAEERAGARATYFREQLGADDIGMRAARDLEREDLVAPDPLRRLFFGARGGRLAAGKSCALTKADAIVPALLAHLEGVCALMNAAPEVGPAEMLLRLEPILRGAVHARRRCAVIGRRLSSRDSG